MCCSLVNLSFSSETYEIYEHQEILCVTVNYGKRAPFDVNVEITEGRGNATSKLYNHHILSLCLSIMSGGAKFI